MEYQQQDTIDMYRWLVGNLRLRSVEEPASSFGHCPNKSIHDEKGTANREIVAKHLAYILLYMFLVAEVFL